jgi:hypothetical protein
MPLAIRAFEHDRLAQWAFEHYLAIAPPAVALSPSSPAPRTLAAA